uniref:Uncharacterized protein n=1 Tax=Anguilla anguilla TaxID=7936 RepID=A0A0E9T4L0_ANGAN
MHGPRSIGCCRATKTWFSVLTT